MGEAQEIGKKLNKIHKPKFDWILTLLVAILIGFGFLITIIKEQKTQNYCLEQHIIYFILGISFPSIELALNGFFIFPKMYSFNWFSIPLFLSQPK